MKAVLSLGSNIGDSYALLRQAAQAFSTQVTAASSIFATPPWGVVDQPNFLNAVLIVDTQFPPQELLQFCQHLEQEGRRERKQHWGPRTLDVDIVDIEGYTSTDPQLQVPHPYAHQRAFVLIPWLQADPTATLSGVPLPELLAALPPEERAGIVDTGQALLGGSDG